MSHHNIALSTAAARRYIALSTAAARRSRGPFRCHNAKRCRRARHGGGSALVGTGTRGVMHV
ncbi:MAG: hypothetical protein IPG43_21200 [Proteobacteria bacterium]|nr:hypothetical protein [Pseudomonadota bacterium]